VDNSVLSQLLAGGESEQVEFVAGVGKDAHVEEAACAFLNARGGIIVAGVGKGGKVQGVDGATAKAKTLRQRLGESISPPASLSVSVDELDGKDVIVIDVPQGLEKPYVCNGRIMTRRGTSVASATADEMSALIGQRVLAEGRWERLPALGVDDADFDTALILKVAQAIREGRGFEIENTKKVSKILDRLGLVQNGQYTNAAVVLFAKNPADLYPQTRVRAAKFRGDDRTEFADNRVFEGNLFTLVESVVMFVAEHTPITATIAPDQLRREDRPAYPRPAVREAVVNALVHRDYAAFDGGVSVAVFDDRIEVWNSGRLPSEMTVEDLRTAHPSRPINPDIAQVCFLYGLMERWGIGTQKIIRACVEAGLPEPEWKVGGGGVTLTMRLSEATRTVSAASHLNLRQIAAVQKVRPGEQVKVPDYLKLVAGEVRERQARTDLTELTEAGYFQRVGAGPGTVYVRTKKAMTGVPGG
jgi:ATP-dependent DNA helicase RecG